MLDLILGDSRDILPTLAADSVDAVVTDPPAGIAFMGKGWDRAQVMQDMLPVVLRECLRIARPGSVLLCWALPRTSHWTGLAIEAAGWQIEDRIAHAFGTGFPKHRSKLKPATEDWWLARKPGPKWLGVDACRVESPGNVTFDREAGDRSRENYRTGTVTECRPATQGRWPSNLVLSHGPDCGESCGDGCPVRLLGEQSGETRSGGYPPAGQPRTRVSTYGEPTERGEPAFGSSVGHAARFFPCFDHDPFIYAAKASRRDRNEGCEGMPAKPSGKMQDDAYQWRVTDTRPGRTPHDAPRATAANHHPTVKSVHLMRWLCRLACPPGGTILDPFMGSGSTGKAAMLEGFRFVGVEQDPEYHAIATRRIRAATSDMPLFGEITAIA